MNSNTERQMFGALAGVIVAFVVLFIVLKFADEIDGIRKVTYDCRLAEISPDFPLEVKQKCRELMRGNK